MSQKIGEKVSVVVAFDHAKRKTQPIKVVWRNHTYTFKQFGFYHKYKHGDTTFHVISAVCDNLNFRLTLNSETLSWTLDEVFDANIG
ncbi:hypothetical protein KAZ57_03275 [Patescibacteria group bacterium]|nr:hypothetical protein [Patescibacteria group bacterium]